MNVRPLAVLIPAFVIASVSVATAQQPPPRPAPLPAPLPAAPAALSVPDPFTGTHRGPRDLYQSPDGSDRFQHLSRHPVPPVVFTPGIYYPSGFPYPYGMPSFLDPYYRGPHTETIYPQRPHELVARGGLVLQTIPDMAQVFVDGYYVGLAEEFGLHGKAMDIAAGTHRIEIRAAGYETLAFTVKIAPNDIVRYRGDMQPLDALARPTPVAAPAPAVASRPAAAKSFYVIPNCYAGDKPPSSALPKGCDLKNLQTRK